MGDYNRTIWKDHIKDQNGNIIQQGTPVSAKNLNNIENQVVALSAKENSLAELVREAIPSGFTTLSDLDYGYMSTNPNTIKLSRDSVAYVNGYKIVIPAGTIITLDAPPTSGNRDDLVFLEAWKQVDANGAEQLSWRIRFIGGVDFTVYPEGFRHCGDYWVYPNMVIPQGGANAPTLPYRFTQADKNDGLPITDAGLFIGGDGSASAKTALNTVDGYVYAIPLFRVHRRNSSGYSVNNGNGSRLRTHLTINNVTISPNVITSITVSDTSPFNVGQYVYLADKSHPAMVNEITNSTQMKITLLKDGGTFWDVYSIYKSNDRPDLLFADIVADRDIIDLRHKVSLTGFNYQSLLEENFDKLLRGELQTTAKTSLLKTYHGIPKTPIDANTVFYASLDGTTIAEIGGDLGVSNQSYISSITGLGLNKIAGSKVINLPNSNYTIDFWVKNCAGTLITFFNGSTQLSIWGNIDFGINSDNKWHHIRLRVVNNIMYELLDGRLVNTWNNPAYFSNATNISLNFGVAMLCDFSISNIDRGTTFATLPQDFIDGYARISTAFNSQRSVFSDALTSEAPLATVHCAGNNNKELAINVSTSTHWTAGDTITVKGLGGEIITGVVDADTALFRILSVGSDGQSINVDDVSKVSIGDTFMLFNTVTCTTGYSKTITAISGNTITFTGQSMDNSWVAQWNYGIEATASSSSPIVKTNLNGTAASATSNTIVLPSTFSTTDSAYNGLTITITGGTGIGQSRTISAYTGSTKSATLASAWTTIPDTTSTFLITGVTVAGTWSNLGTNAATFTLGTLTAALTSQDLYINYSLNEVAGAGGISEVLVTTLAGESNGKRLVVNPSIHVRDDFAGKVSGSTTICPNVFKSLNTSSTLGAPSAFPAEFTTSQYQYISALDGSTQSLINSNNGQIPQQLFSFNLIRIIEDKFGPLPCPPDTASKVTWLKANIKSFTCNWWGYGSCPSGGTHANSNYACLSIWDGTSWQKIYELSSKVVPTLATFNNIDMNRIDQNGFVNYLAYTDASDGVTPSTIYTDYCNIEILFNTPNGYDVLAPENPRRDDGKGNILLVRKETREIQTMFPRSNVDGLVTYGDYVTKQGYMMYVNASAINLTKAKGFMLSNGTGKAGLSNNGYFFVMERASNLNLDDAIYSLNLDDCTTGNPNNTGFFNSWSERKYYYSNLDIMPCAFGVNYGYRTDKVLVPNNILDISDCVVAFKQYLPISVFNKLMGIYTLVVYNNELYLVILARVISGNYSWFTCMSGSTTYNGCYMYKLNKRPLIK